MLLTQSNRKFWSGAPTALQSTMKSGTQTYDSINGELHLHLRFSGTASSHSLEKVKNLDKGVKGFIQKM